MKLNHASVLSILFLWTACDNKKVAPVPNPSPGTDDNSPGSPANEPGTPRDLNQLPSSNSSITLRANPPRSWVWHGKGNMPSFECNEKEDDIRLKSMAQTNVNVSSIYVGFSLLPSTPSTRVLRMARFDEGNKIWCRQDLTSANTDSFAYGMVWDGGPQFYVVTSSSAPDTPRFLADWGKFTALGWIKNPPQPQKRSAVVGQVDTQNGSILNATILYTLDQKSQQADVRVLGISMKSDGIQITGEGAGGAGPVDGALKALTCDTLASRKIVWTLDRDLKKAQAVTAEGCR